MVAEGESVSICSFGVYELSSSYLDLGPVYVGGRVFSPNTFHKMAVGPLSVSECDIAETYANQRAISIGDAALGMGDSLFSEH